MQQAFYLNHILLTCHKHRCSAMDSSKNVLDSLPFRWKAQRAKARLWKAQASKLCKLLAMAHFISINKCRLSNCFSTRPTYWRHIMGQERRTSTLVLALDQVWAYK